MSQNEGAQPGRWHMGAIVKLRGRGELVAQVYEGIEEATPWKSLMQGLGEMTSAHDASMVITSIAAPGAYYLVTDNEDPRTAGPEYISGVMAANDILEIPQPRTSTADELMPNGEFQRSRIYQQFLKPLNIRHLLGRDVLRDDLLQVRIAVERTEDQAPFGTRERELIDLIAPHLQRALRLRELHSSGTYMRHFFEEAMAKLAIGCVMLDVRGQVLSMNTWARQLLGRQDALLLRHGQLRTAQGIDGRALQRAIELALAAYRNACRCQPGTALQIESAPGMALVDVVVKPLASDPVFESHDTPAAVIYLNDSQRPGIDVDPGVLGSMYGFTPCESRLGALLLRGTTLEEASATLGVSINTIKTHLRGVYEKTGTNKQVQVVARLNHCAARLL